MTDEAPRAATRESPTIQRQAVCCNEARASEGRRDEKELVAATRLFVQVEQVISSFETDGCRLLNGLDGCCVKMGEVKYET